VNCNNVTRRQAGERSNQWHERRPRKNRQLRQRRALRAGPSVPAKPPQCRSGPWQAVSNPSGQRSRGPRDTDEACGTALSYRPSQTGYSHCCTRSEGLYPVAPAMQTAVRLRLADRSKPQHAAADDQRLDPGPEAPCTVVTEARGPLAERRVVRGREGECAAYYAAASSQSVPAIRNSSKGRSHANEQ
jgi:hypothetical protein